VYGRAARSAALAGAAALIATRLAVISNNFFMIFRIQFYR
jgi:hypothetical protein